MPQFFVLKGEVMTPLALVSYNKETNEASVINYTDDFLSKPFGALEDITAKDVLYYLEHERCVPRTRDRVYDYLKVIGLYAYDPEAIVKATKGRMAGDDFYIEYLEE